MVCLGVDPGEKRTGVAKSDPMGVLAQPLDIVSGPEELLALIRKILEDYDLRAVVVGLPRNMDGSIGPIAQRSFPLVRQLREALPVPVYLWDERLTTAQIVRADGGKKRGRPVDDRAAAVLLQSYLDAGCPAPADPPEMK